MSVFVARYARAFADVVSQEKLDTAALDRQLDDFLATWEGSSALREVFANPAVAAVQKIAVLDKMNVKTGAPQGAAQPAGSAHQERPHRRSRRGGRGVSSGDAGAAGHSPGGRF
jgi:hypothetical protein